MTNTPTSLDPIDQLPTSQPLSQKSWTGFAGKTLWDWINLLGVFLIPIVIAAGSIWFSIQQNITGLQLSDKQHQSDQVIALDQQRATTLKTYMDDMTGMLLHEGLRESKADTVVSVIATAQTLVALSQLDGVRKGTLIQFLYHAQLIGQENSKEPIIRLTSADLSGASLRTTILRVANLSEANLSEANLSEANLRVTHLNKANLRGADLSKVDLRGANLSGADLNGANLGGANLDTVKEVTPEQLAKARTLKDTVLPDGSHYPSSSYPIPNHQEPTN